MATSKKTTNKAAAKKPNLKMSDLKPSKDAKGGGRHAETNKNQRSLNRARNLN